MTMRIGVVGVGNMGSDHVRRLSGVIAGARVVAVSDVDPARADTVAGGVPGGARVFPGGPELIRDPDVDAVLIASWAHTHEELVLAAIAQGKPVFCEKPLAPSTAACRRIMDAEIAHGRRLLQVGFMRRYDPGYRAMKQALVSGEVGTPLMIHCAHRTASLPLASFTTAMAIGDAAIHEIDIVRWLLEQEIVATSVLTPRRAARAGEQLQDPLIVVLETADGVLVDDEVFLNCSYGYDVRCELVGELGTVSLGEGSDVLLRKDGRRAGRVPADWIERFARAYHVEVQAWVASLLVGQPGGPSAWDGYAATAVAESCLQALESGRRTPVQAIERPAFYR